jgi:5-oxopent-3-ene-1,2,5-tricarboxylate decarboxylase/2-hydroxyhepta-2,4-diene-1,7-dioate isomerase
VSSPFALWAGPRIEVAPFRLSGTVYATLLNHRRSLEALGDAVAAAPYKGAPKSVVLAVKPRQALVAPAATCRSTAARSARGRRRARRRDRHDRLRRRRSRRARPRRRLLVVCDCTLPRAGHFRPQIRAMARDASCVSAPP